VWAFPDAALQIDFLLEATQRRINFKEQDFTLWVLPGEKKHDPRSEKEMSEIVLAL